MTEFLLCGSSNSWLLNYETLWTVTKSDLLISMLETLTQLVSIGLCYWREEGWLCPWWKSTFTILRLLSSSNWIGALTLSLLPKLPMRKLDTWFIRQGFFLLRLGLSLQMCQVFFISGFGYLKTNTELLTRRWPQSTDIINWTISNLKSRSPRTS